MQYKRYSTELETVRYSHKQKLRIQQFGGKSAERSIPPDLGHKVLGACLNTRARLTDFVNKAANTIAEMYIASCTKLDNFRIHDNNMKQKKTTLILMPTFFKLRGCPLVPAKPRR